MSDKGVDMAKVTQALDAGWSLELFKCGLGSYAVQPNHDSAETMAAAAKRIRDKIPVELTGVLNNDNDADMLLTDDFTPAKALTRAAYKVVDGAILGVDYEVGHDRL